MTRSRTHRILTIIFGAVVSGAFFAPAAFAQQMGREGYSFPARSASLAAQFDFQRRAADSAAASSADGLNALTQYVTTYTSSSTSIGNMTTVNQTLGDGTNGTVGVSGDQASEGNQGSGATTETAVDNSLTNTGTISEILGPTTPQASN